ncbi:MAG TPA: lysophospholipid acyltransferase family protein [Desulfomonilia bacterium]|nr:lysophospholipid acyltransferase family protein [Desulfomonilia bacterium]
MIDDLLYRCPLCNAFEWLEKNQCAYCNAKINLVTRSLVSIGSDVQPISYWYKKIQSFELPHVSEGTVLKSRRVRLSHETQSGMFKGYAGITAYHFTRTPVDAGSLTLTEHGLNFKGATGKIELTFDEVLGVTIESNTVIIITKEHGPLFFDFLEESGKKWEDLIQKVLRRHHHPNEILEFYPRVRVQGSFRKNPSKLPGHRTLKVPKRKWYRNNKSMLSLVLKPIARPILKKIFSVKLEGIENIPATGPAIVTPNHTSFLDSVILGFFSRRDIWFMAKNSEYRHVVMKWFLRHAGSFPVRRYTIDVQAIRNAVRVIQNGHILGIFPEGERTWDGDMLPLRIGAIRLLLALNTPVIPVGISGAYELMPRWTSSIKLSDVKISIGKPIRFAHIPIPRQTKADIDSASTELHSQIQQLIGGTK